MRSVSVRVPCLDIDDCRPLCKGREPCCDNGTCVCLDLMMMDFTSDENPNNIKRANQKP